MITLLIITLFVLVGGVFLKLVGVAFALSFWLLIKIPLALILWALGLAFCCTIILIPIGFLFFKIGTAVLIPAC